MVFTELFQDEEGNQTPLAKKNVDTGMGLERIAMVCQGVESTFETDVLRHIIEKVSQISGKKYKEQIRELRNQISELYAEDMLGNRAINYEKQTQGKEVSDIG